MGRKSMADERRSQIVDAFYRCLVERGLEGSSNINIAREADITTSLITHYFENKDDMMLELTFRTVEMYELMYLEPLEGLEDPRERLEKLLTMMFDDEYMDRPFLMVFVAMLYRATRSEKVKQAITGMFERLVRELKDLLIEAAGLGGIEDKHAHEIAVQIVALQDGITEHWLLGTDEARPGMALEMVNCILKSSIGIELDRVD